MMSTEQLPVTSTLSQRADMKPSPPGRGALRDVPRTGVIYVMNEARRAGYQPGEGGWVNLGQGQPEAGALPGAPARYALLEAPNAEYAPVEGLWALRDAVAQYYNRRYRRGMKSQYQAENVCISPGGRAALTRITASLGAINLGHFLPDYTAYEELLGLFRFFTPIPILLDPAEGYAFSARSLEREILGRGLSALLASNPCNPTGRLIAGEELAEWVQVARRLDCALILDEFYSHYIWGDAGPSVSAAGAVEDVDRDPVLLIDGLTKNWRYPGWRVAWTVGPREMIDRLASAGSFLDGGASRPAQRAALPLLEAGHIDAESSALKESFLPKRALLCEGLEAMGISLDRPPEGTFYAWGNLSGLPPQLREGMRFFRAALEERVICVPGLFFDINPGQRRPDRPSRFRNHVRFSFGPPAEQLKAGIERLSALVQRARSSAS